MEEQITVAIIKPDAVEARHTGSIIAMAEAAGLRVARMHTVRWTQEFAEQFYYDHREKAFFAELLEFMQMGDSVIVLLAGPDAIRKWRELMGATDPSKAAPGTVRALYGRKDKPMMWNAVHGSDGEEAAEWEMLLLRQYLGFSEYPIRRKA